MMKYIDFSLHEFAEPEDANFILNKAVNRLHGIMRSQGLNMGIDFPESTPKGLGDRLRVFGVKEDLSRVIENPGICELSSRGMVRMSDILEIPENSQAVRLKRVRRKGHNELLKKARERRQFFIDKGNSPDSLPSVRSLAAKYRDESLCPYMLIEREARKFCLFFRRELISGNGAPSLEGFNSYGLSSDTSAYVFSF